MKEIALSQGKVMLVDEEDFEILSKYKWTWFKSRYTEYAMTDLGKRNRVLAHRFLMGSPKQMLIDHIDGNGLNNCKVNLRICSIVQNNRKARKRKDNTSGF